jgi:hypothetical protein
MLDAPHTKDR